MNPKDLARIFGWLLLAGAVYALFSLRDFGGCLNLFILSIIALMVYLSIPK